MPTRPGAHCIPRPESHIFIFYRFAPGNYASRVLANRESGTRMQQQRISRISRKTAETKIEMELNLDGSGASALDTGLPFFDHMLGALARHGGFDLRVQASGDLQVDAHHLVEDLGLVLGQALRQALGDKNGIERFAAAAVPLDDALARVVVDLSGRPYLAYRVRVDGCAEVGGVRAPLFREFFQALANAGGLNLHVDLLAGDEVHHVFEAIFKALARALREAVAVRGRVSGVPSTKGVLE